MRFVKDTCRDRKRFDPGGYKPGPELGEVLKEMLEHVLEEPSDNTKEKLMEFINKEKY